MSEINEEVNNFDNIMEKIKNTMNEIDSLKKTSLENSKKSLESLQNFYTRFLIFVIMVNHFHVLIDTNYSLVSMLYNTIDEISVNDIVEDSVNEIDYDIIDYAQDLEIEEVD